MRFLFESALMVASAAGIAYLAFALQRTLAFGRRRAQSILADDFAPAVSVLKPLAGLEPELFENLCSFCDQEYHEYQIIFGVRDAADPAAAVARRVIEQFPGRDVSLLVDARVRGTNFKIANVLNLIPLAKHDILIVADSDIRVDSSYLRSVVAPFANEQVGAVTCLYRGVPVEPARPLQTLSSELGAMFINDQFAPSVLVAIGLSPMDFCLGATMAVTRKALELLGGFEALSSHLADDRMLGKLVRDRDLRVELSSYVVENIVCERRPRGLWDHEVRWARTMSAARPLGYAFSFITYALPVSFMYLLVCTQAYLGWTVVGLAVALRLALHYAARSALRVRGPDRPWLIPVRDLLGLVVWGASFFGRGVRWRDRDFAIDAEGRLLPRTEPDHVGGKHSK